MEEREKVERVLVPYVKDRFPERAEGEALERLKKGGTLFLLHIVDEAQVRSVRYKTGHLGEKSEIIKTFKETQEEVQKKAAGEHAEKVVKNAAKYGISVRPLHMVGNPAEKVLEAVDDYSIELILFERLRERVAGIFLGDGANYLREKAPCEVSPVS